GRPDLHQGSAARSARRGHARAAVPDDRGHDRARLLPGQGVHRVREPARVRRRVQRRGGRSPGGGPVTPQVVTALEIGAGETALFWTLGPLSVIFALGLLFARKSVHAALCMVAVMLIAGVFYIANEAQFVGIIQIVVYSGAVMMLFLFVVMLVGIDASDSLIETIKGQRAATLVAALGLLVLLTATI